MTVRYAEAVWEGSLREGEGRMRLGSGGFEGNYTFASRFEEGVGTNPEELIGAAHAGCFSMAFSGDLGRAGYTPERIETKAQVFLERVDGKPTIVRIHLDSKAVVPGIDQETFMKVAQGAKAGCPVSRALESVEITLEARLVDIL
jgi:osmotically inducible protein OsmC